MNKKAVHLYSESQAHFTNVMITNWYSGVLLSVEV